MADSTEKPTGTLTEKSCKPCEGGVKPLDRDEATALLGQLSDWELTHHSTQLSF